MKTTITAKHLFASIAFLAIVEQTQAQSSIQLKIDGKPNTLAPNDIIYLDVPPETNVKVTIDVKNTSNSTKSYVAKRYDVLLNSDATSTAQAYFCIAGTCYAPPTLVSPTPLTLTAQQSASDLQGPYQMLVADLDEASTQGPSIVKYTFQNTALPADSVQITIKYNEAKITGIESQSKAAFGLEISPIPAKDVITVKSTALPGKAGVTIIDGLGKVLYSQQISKDEAETGYKIELTGKPSGIYYLVLNSQEAVVTRKIILD